MIMEVPPNTEWETTFHNQTSDNLEQQVLSQFGQNVGCYLNQTNAWFSLFVKCFLLKQNHDPIRLHTQLVICHFLAFEERCCNHIQLL